MRFEVREEQRRYLIARYTTWVSSLNLHPSHHTPHTSHLTPSQKIRVAGLEPAASRIQTGRSSVELHSGDGPADDDHSRSRQTRFCTGCDNLGGWFIPAVFISCVHECFLETIPNTIIFQRAKSVPIPHSSTRHQQSASTIHVACSKSLAAPSASPAGVPTSCRLHLACMHPCSSCT